MAVLREAIRVISALLGFLVALRGILEVIENAIACAKTSGD